MQTAIPPSSLLNPAHAPFSQSRLHENALMFNEWSMPLTQDSVKDQWNGVLVGVFKNYSPINSRQTITVESLTKASPLLVSTKHWEI